jgi:plasmid stability protein
MATTLTLKNVPDDLYARLKASADAHHRSLNSEAIVCLETVLKPQRIPVEDRLVRIRKLRESLDPKAFDHREIDTLKRDGRP